PCTDSLSGSRPPMKFLSRNAGIDTLAGGPPAAGGGDGDGVGSGFGGGGGGGAELSATSTSAGRPLRTTSSRSSVTKPSRSKRRRYVPSRRPASVATPDAS